MLWVDIWLKPSVFDNHFVVPLDILSNSLKSKTLLLVKGVMSDGKLLNIFISLYITIQKQIS